MAKRFIDTGIFRKPLVRALEAPYKLLWVYLQCECDHAGFWIPEMDVAQSRLSIKMTQEKALTGLGDLVAVMPGGEWWLVDFAAFQYGRLNPANRAHAAAISLLSERGLVGKDHQPIRKALTSPLEGAKDKEKDMEKEKGEEVQEEGPPFDTFWTAYLRKGSRKISEERWSKLPAADRQAAIDRIPDYFTYRPDPQFRKDGERYLKDRVWEDDFETVMAATNGETPMTWQEALAEEEAIRARSGREIVEPHEMSPRLRKHNGF